AAEPVFAEEPLIQNRAHVQSLWNREGHQRDGCGLWMWLQPPFESAGVAYRVILPCSRLSCNPAPPTQSCLLSFFCGFDRLVTPVPGCLHVDSIFLALFLSFQLAAYIFVQICVGTFLFFSVS
ncbi:unnamed protein product, partial [Ectocarpus sp. 8 AP-2014]